MYYTIYSLMMEKNFVAIGQGRIESNRIWFENGLYVNIYIEEGGFRIYSKKSSRAN